MQEARATSKTHGPCPFELGFLPKGALSIAGLASQSEYWSVPSNQDLRQAGFILGRGCMWVLRGGQGYKWALLLSLVSGAGIVGELGSCAMVSEGPLSPGGEGRWLSHRSRCDGCSSGLGRGRQPAKQPRPWAGGLWAAPPLGRFCAEQGSSERLRPALGTLGLVTSQVCRRSEPMLFLSGGLVAKSRYS